MIQDSTDDVDGASGSEYPPSYEEAVQRAKKSLRRISASSVDADALSTAASTSGGERQPLLARLPPDQISIVSERHAVSPIRSYFKPLILASRAVCRDSA